MGGLGGGLKGLEYDSLSRNMDSVCVCVPGHADIGLADEQERRGLGGFEGARVWQSVMQHGKSWLAHGNGGGLKVCEGGQPVMH